MNPACLDARINPEDSLVMPIGLYYIGALLKKNNIDVHLVNLAVEHDPDAWLAWLTEKEKPDMVGFSVINANRIHAMTAAGIIKKIRPEATVVFGGPCATFMDSQLLDMCPDIDFIIKGEGEYTLLELIQARISRQETPYDTIPGLVFKQDRLIIRTPDREPLPDLDALPHPSLYFSYPHLVMSRGCPGKCTFCGSPRFWGRSCVRFHSARWMADEISALYEKGIRHFFISDDTFTMDRDRVLELCRFLTAASLEITWNAISRVDHIDEELLLQMRKAGCIQISYGVESGSAGIRKTLGKPVKATDILRAFHLTTSYGIMPRAYFIYGSPGESFQTIQESCDLMSQIKPLSAVFYMLTLFPGTALYETAVKKKQISESVWEQPIEDMPWFEIDPDLDFETIRQFGDRLRQTFFGHLSGFAASIELIDDKSLYLFHADFLSRLAMTFSHGEYANHPLIHDPGKTAMILYKRALSYSTDARAFLGLGMLHQRNKDFERAASILEQGLTHFPENRELNVCMALTRMNQGDFKTALHFLEKFRHLPEIRQYIDVCNAKLKGQS